jgi:hypothetical protein
MVTQIPHALVELLFIRAVSLLPVAASLSAAAPAPNASGSRRPADSGIEQRWEVLWGSAIERLDQPGEAESWGLRYGLEGINVDELRHWSNSVVQSINDVAAEYHHAPETILRQQLESASLRGLRSLVVIPVGGHYASKVSPQGRHLLISTATYVDVSALRQAVEDLVA